MSFNYLKPSRTIVLSIFLSFMSIGLFNSDVKASNQSSIFSQANKSLDINQNLSIDSSQAIPRRNQKLIANSLSGEASWYGPGFHGRLTANGERYDQNAMTAAHKSLKFGTNVKVTNLNNGKSVTVRINDRGPYIDGRIIDVSAAAARSLDMIHSGVAPVRVDILGR